MISWIKKLLEQIGVAFEEVREQMAFLATGALPGEPGSGHRLARVKVALIEGRPAVFIVPASRRVLLSRVEKLLGTDDVHIASEYEIDGLFGHTATGAIPAQRHSRDLEVLMDASLLTAEALVLLAGARSHFIGHNDRRKADVCTSDRGQVTKSDTNSWTGICSSSAC
jgi:prolyl-tRNA editing enzyme YbaK/EbsC (Cys-tRNA(Pro) deacylase)